MEKLVYDKDMRFALKFKWDDPEAVWLNIEGVEIQSYQEDAIGQPDYSTVEYDNYCDGDTDYQRTYNESKLLHGHIKWDGCMEIHEFNHHWCGYDTFAQRIVEMIYEQASEIMGKQFDHDLARWKNK